MIEASGVEYTILQPTWFSVIDEVEKDLVISQKAVNFDIGNHGISLKLSSSKSGRK